MESPHSMSQPAKEQAKSKAEPQKPKAKKHRMRGDLYDLSGAVAKLKNRKCPRCGSVMAFHGGTAQRWGCGSCSFSSFMPKINTDLLFLWSFFSRILLGTLPRLFFPYV